MDEDIFGRPNECRWLSWRVASIIINQVPLIFDSGLLLTKLPHADDMEPVFNECHRSQVKPYMYSVDLLETKRTHTLL
jgi:hypothetical protein